MKKIIQNLFSIKNIGKHKVITILGIKFKIKSKKLIKRLGFQENSFLEDICSVKNIGIHKVFTLSGVKLKFKSKKLIKRSGSNKNSFLEDIFSVKNNKNGVIRRKVLTVLGLKIKVRYKIKNIKIPYYENPLVSIVIPVYNQIDYTLNCLYSIQKNIGNIPFEIIIADDCSTDGTKQIENKVKNIIISRNETNLGYIKNCNNAAKLARGRYLYFLNNDTEVQPNWLQELIDVLENHSDIGVVGSKILNPNGSLQECGVYMFKDQFHNRIKGRNPNLQVYNYLRQCDYVSGCSMLTYKWLFDEIGGFDVIFSPAYCDDPDYCLSALSKGFKTYVQPKSKIIHYGSISYSETCNDLMRRNNNILRTKWKEFFNSRTNYDKRKDCTALTRKPTILVVDDFFPQFDRHAGGKTIFQFLELFVKMGLNIKFCPLYGYNYEEPYFSILTNMGIEILEQRHIHSWIEENISFIDYILLSRPRVAQNFMIKSLKARGIKVLYYGHDLHHVRMTRESAYKENYNPVKIEQMKKTEYTAISSSDIALYPSSFEKEYIENELKLNNAEVITPYLYNLNTMTKHNDFDNSRDIIFVGSSHGPNLNGLLWFINDIFPLVVKQIPDIVLNIVGSSIAPEIKKIKSKNIKVVGYLSEEELNELYSKTKLSIAPLRYGAGIKGKIIDSLYHSTPVVTTPIGVEGIDDKYNLVKVSINEKDYAENIVELYSNKQKWDSLIPLYAKFIEENYSFDCAEDTFRQFIDTKELPNEAEAI